MIGALSALPPTTAETMFGKLPTGAVRLFATKVLKCGPHLLGVYKQLMHVFRPRDQIEQLALRIGACRQQICFGSHGTD